MSGVVMNTLTFAADANAEGPASVCRDLGVGVMARHVPFSRSRHVPKDGGEVADLLHLRMCWRVALTVRGRVVVETDYAAGVAHCRSYKTSRTAPGRLSVHDVECIRHECETGYPGHVHRSGVVMSQTMPDPLDVVGSLMSDSEAVDHPTFEEWACNLGYDPDSREGERMYRACLEIGLRIRAALGDAGFACLRDAFQDH